MGSKISVDEEVEKSEEDDSEKTPLEKLIAEINNNHKEYMDKGDFKSAAMTIQDGIIQVDEELGGKKNVESAKLLQLLAETHTMNHKKNEAVEAQQLAIKIFLTTAGPKSEETYAALISLADIYVRFEEWADSLPLFEKLVQIEKRKFGKNSERYMRMLLNLAKTQMAAGMPDEDKDKKDPIVKHLKKAIKTFKKLLKILEKKHDDEQESEPDSAMFLGVLLRAGRVEMTLRHLDSAMTYADRAEALAGSSIFGKNTMEYSRSLTALSILRQKFGQYKMATKLMKQALAIAKSLHAEDSIEVRKAENNLQGLQRYLGVLEAAKKNNISLDELNKGVPSYKKDEL